MDKRFNFRIDKKMLKFIKKYKKEHNLNDDSDSAREIISKQEKIENESFIQKIKSLFFK